MLDIDRFIADCRGALAQDHTEMMVRDLVARAVADRSAVEATLGHPTRGGLFTLHRSPELTILNIVWAPGMAIYPHEHGMWAVLGLYGGREDNTFYRCSSRGGDFFDTPRSEWTPGTLVERPFDMERARRAYADANERWERKAP